MVKMTNKKKVQEYNKNKITKPLVMPLLNNTVAIANQVAMIVIVMRNH